MSDKLTEKSEKSRKGPSRSDIAMLVSLIVLSVLLFGLYRFFMGYHFFKIVMIAYMVIGALFVLVYLIYNRGFSRKGVTPEMLPAEWSDEEKDSFIKSGEQRIKRSRWMLVVILAFMFTFTVDIIELWVVPTVMGWFGL